MNKENLKKIANQMVIKGKGILAADESTPTCTKRFETGWRAYGPETGWLKI